MAAILAAILNMQISLKGHKGQLFLYFWKAGLIHFPVIYNYKGVVTKDKKYEAKPQNVHPVIKNPPREFRVEKVNIASQLCFPFCVEELLMKF